MKDLPNEDIINLKNDIKYLIQDRNRIVKHRDILRDESLTLHTRLKLYKVSGYYNLCKITKKKFIRINDLIFILTENINSINSQIKKKGDECLRLRQSYKK